MKKALDITPNLEPLFGTRDENLRLMEDNLNVRIDLKSDGVHVEGPPESIAKVQGIFADYEHLRRAGVNLHNGELHGMLKLVVADPTVTLRSLAESGKQRSAGIKRMVQAAFDQPAPLRRGHRAERHGLRHRPRRHRQGPTSLSPWPPPRCSPRRSAESSSSAPAVEAGERLGFLPGSLQEKIDPYLRPLVRRPLRPARPGARRQDAGAQRHRGRSPRLHARTHPQRCLHHHGRGPEHHQRADEDVPHPPRQQRQSGHHRRHHPRSTCPMPRSRD